MAGGRRGRGGRGKKAALVSHFFTLVLVAGAACGGYAVYYIRRFQRTLPLLEDRVSSQARQLDEIRQLLKDRTRS